MSWRVVYAQQFHDQLMELPDSIYDRIERSIDVLALNPGLAREYDPAYEAAQPPLPCRWYAVPHTTKVIYLVLEAETQELTFVFLGDGRADPLHRFDYTEW